MLDIEDMERQSFGHLLFDQLPDGNEPGFKMYPDAVLTRNISDTEMVIPLDDVSIFPPTGIVLIGAEPIKYSSVECTDTRQEFIPRMDMTAIVPMTIRLCASSRVGRMRILRLE